MTLARWLVRPGQEDAFVAAWRELGAFCLSRQQPRRWGLRLRSVDLPRLFSSFGPWPSLGAIAAMRADPRAAAALGRLAALREEASPGTYLVAATGRAPPPLLRSPAADGPARSRAHSRRARYLSWWLTGDASRPSSEPAPRPTPTASPLPCPLRSSLLPPSGPGALRGRCIGSPLAAAPSVGDAAGRRADRRQVCVFLIGAGLGNVLAAWLGLQEGKAISPARRRPSSRMRPRLCRWRGAVRSCRGREAWRARRSRVSDLRSAPERQPRRKRRLYSQGELGKLVNRSAADVRRMESGEGRVRWSTLERLAEALGVTVVDLIVTPTEDATLEAYNAGGMGPEYYPGTAVLACIDPFSRVVVARRDWWIAHVLDRHPEVDGHEGAVQRTIEWPDVVTRDAEYPNGVNYYRMDALPGYAGKYLKVAVGYDPDNSVGVVAVGEVVTAYPTRRVKKGEQHLWP